MYNIGILPICQVVIVKMPKEKLDSLEFSRRIADLRKEVNLNKRQFADSLQISQSVIGDIELGYREPSREVMLKLASVYNVNIHWLLTGEGEMLLGNQEKSLEAINNKSVGYKIPLLNQSVSCGSGVDWADEQNIAGYIDIFEHIPPHMRGKIIGLTVKGNSMLGAGIRDGDCVVCFAEANKSLADDIYIFSLDGEVYCKQLEFDGISKRIKIYSIREVDMEKAELLTTLDSESEYFYERFHIFGRVFTWIHPNPSRY